MQNPETSAEINSCKNREQYSPDITCITLYQSTEESQSVEGQSEAVVVDASIQMRNDAFKMNQNNLHLNPIAEVPPGFYEYLNGENGELRILCKICKYVSNKKSNFKRHFTNMHFIHEDDSKLMECCGIRFSTKGEKFHHTKSVHKTGYKCTICSKIFDRPALLQRHLAKHTGKKPYKCSLCSYQTPNKANAKRHIEKRHSDVDQGSILFVTDDGEQIQIEVVSKSDKESSKEGSSPGSSSSASIPINNKYSPKSISNCFPFLGDEKPVVTRLKFPRTPTATVTSTSLTSPGCFGGPLNYSYGLQLDEKQDSKKIGHSIENIMNPGKSESQELGNLASIPIFQSGGNQGAGSLETQKPTNAEFAVPASSSFIPGIGYNQYNHHQPINELPLSNYCSPNWTHLSAASSSPLPLNCYVGRRAQPQNQTQAYPLIHGATNNTTNIAASSAPVFLQHHRSNFPLVFQCYYGCWHHMDNHHSHQVTSDFAYPRTTSFVTPFNSSPDLRSSSSFSQHTENSSVNSAHHEEEEADEYDENDDSDIDVEDLDEDEATSTRKKLKSICDELGTTEISLRAQSKQQQYEEGRFETSKNGNESTPPAAKSMIASTSKFNPMQDQYHNGLESKDGPPSAGMVTNEPGPVQGEEDVVAYIPKKLRMSKAYSSIEAHKTL